MEYNKHCEDIRGKETGRLRVAQEVQGMAGGSMGTVSDDPAGAETSPVRGGFITSWEREIINLHDRGLLLRGEDGHPYGG